MQRRELRDAFRVFDQDNSGFISEKVGGVGASRARLLPALYLQELGKVLNDLGIKVDNIRKMLRDADQNQNGSVSFKELCAILGTAAVEATECSAPSPPCPLLILSVCGAGYRKAMGSLSSSSSNSGSLSSSSVLPPSLASWSYSSSDFDFGDALGW